MSNATMQCERGSWPAAIVSHPHRGSFRTRGGNTGLICLRFDRQPRVAMSIMIIKICRIRCGWSRNDLQRRNAVTVNFKSEQLRPFDFAWQGRPSQRQLETSRSVCQSGVSVVPHDVDATLNQRHWGWFNVATIRRMPSIDNKDNRQTKIIYFDQSIRWLNSATNFNFSTRCGVTALFSCQRELTICHIITQYKKI